MISFGSFLRVALAMALFLAGVAGARLQVEASAIRIALGSAELCLSDGGTSGEAPEGQQHRHDTCALCAQLLADAPASLHVANQGAWLARVGPPLRLVAHHDLRLFRTSARGPPLVA